MEYELYFLVFMAVVGVAILAKETIATLYKETKDDIEKLLKKRDKKNG